MCPPGGSVEEVTAEREKLPAEVDSVCETEPAGNVHATKPPTTSATPTADLRRASPCELCGILVRPKDVASHQAGKRCRRGRVRWQYELEATAERKVPAEMTTEEDQFRIVVDYDPEFTGWCSGLMEANQQKTTEPAGNAHATSTKPPTASATTTADPRRACPGQLCGILVRPHEMCEYCGTCFHCCGKASDRGGRQPVTEYPESSLGLGASAPD